VKYLPQTEPLGDLELPEPRLERPLISFFDLVIQPIARRLGFDEPVVLSPERLVGAYRDFADGKARLIVGFRHAYGDDPQAVAYLFHHALKKAAKSLRVPLRGITHAHFVYGAEVPRWSSAFVGWLLPRVGAVPINHLKMDARGMTRVRKLVTDGPFPLALAPEGHVTHDSESVGELETGTARFALWACEDLARAGRAERVVYLPLSLHYRFGKDARRELPSVLAELERLIGLDRSEGMPLPARARRVAVACMDMLAAHYGVGRGTGQDGAMMPDREALVDAALSRAEGMLSVARAGNQMERVYHVRNAAWAMIFRGEVASMPPLAREIASRSCGEAWYAMRHLETAQILSQVDPRDIPDDIPFDLLVERALNVHDLVERVRGGTLRNRLNRFRKTPVYLPGEPIDMGPYYERYKLDRKASLEEATAAMRARFVDCVAEYRATRDTAAGVEARRG